MKFILRDCEATNVKYMFMNRTALWHGMAETTAARRIGGGTPVQMSWQFDDDGGIVPRLNIEYQPA